MPIQNDLDGSEDTFLEYTMKWINAIDQGGLFRISDNVYIFFHDVEMKLRRHLELLMLDQHQLDKGEIVKEVTSDSSVPFYWSFLAVHLDEEVSQQLLVEIAQLWLTIRAFSEAGAYIKTYKQCSHKATKKSVGLRKGLKHKCLNLDRAED